MTRTPAPPRLAYNNPRPPPTTSPTSPPPLIINDDSRCNSSPDDVIDSPLGGTRSASVQLLSESPLLLVFDHFLSPTECDELMGIASPDLRRSRVTDGKLSDGRTSSSTFLTGARQDHPLVKVIEKRILRAVHSTGLMRLRGQGSSSTRHHHHHRDGNNNNSNAGAGTGTGAGPIEDFGGRWRRGIVDGCGGGDGSRLILHHEKNDLVGAEPMQVVKYTKGQMYTAHYDNKQGCTRRAATFMMYLSDVDAGGATHFPKAQPLTVRERSVAANASGIRIWPKKGRALVFWSVAVSKKYFPSPAPPRPTSLHFFLCLVIVFVSASQVVRLSNAIVLQRSLSPTLDCSRARRELKF